MSLGLWIALSLLIFAGSLLVGVIFMVQLPSDYFSAQRSQTWWAERHPILRWTARILKNVLGVVLIVVGVVLLFVPGQGLLTILMGIMLLEFPGKRRLEKKIIARPKILQAINRLRAYFGREALVVDS